MIFKNERFSDTKMLTIGNQKWFQVEGNEITQNGHRRQLYSVHERQSERERRLEFAWHRLDKRHEKGWNGEGRMRQLK